VRIRMLFAPINPADLNTIEGKYPVRPVLPGVPGVEGAGVVEARGPDVGTPSIGETVLVPHGMGSWRTAANVEAANLVVVPKGVEASQAAMMKINPATAWRMLHDFVELKPGDWIIQNAANSGVGRAVIQISRHLGLKTVNLVRRPELIDELQREGGDITVLDGEDALKEVKAGTSGDSVKLGLNAVGGESAVRLANAVAAGAPIVTFGAMARQPLRIPNGLLIFKDLQFRGFWITQWYQRSTAEVRKAMFSKLFDLSRTNLLKLPVATTFPLDDHVEAIKEANRGGRSGKVLFKPT
jgi:mitochondrial enoyl-[acyl-carrier protein] reductase / trans-2-enoyl-CoA reductase